MNTIGNEKLTMSLDDIIASEPLRYTAPAARPNTDNQSSKMYRPNIYGQLPHEPYKQGFLQQNGSRRPQQNWNGHGKITNKRVGPKPSPYDHNSFKYNGIHVSENSSLLNRRVGEVEITSRPQAEDEYDIEEAEEDDDEDEDGTRNNQVAPTIGVPVDNPRPDPKLDAQPRLYTDLHYVRLPVHQRLGVSASDQFRKSRVDLATKYLRKQQNTTKIVRLPDGSFKKVHNKQFNNKKEKKNRKNILTAQTMAGNSNAMQVSFVNELALGQPSAGQTQTKLQQPRSLFEIDMGIPKHLLPQLGRGNNNNNNCNVGGGDGVFVAPLSRQNVARLPGNRCFVDNSAASSRVSTLTNEEQILERISSMESIVSKLANSSAAVSMMNGFLPAMDPTAAMMSHAGTVMLPVIGGGMQAYVPLVGATTASVAGQQRYAAFQSHIVQPQEGGGLVVQAVGNAGNVETPSGRLRRQLLAAASRQPLTQMIQASISATQAGFRCNNHDRPSQEVFAYRPKPHTTRCSTNDRIKHYPKRHRTKRNN